MITLDEARDIMSRTFTDADPGPAREGFWAYLCWQAGEQIAVSPYQQGTPQYKAWYAGWDAGRGWARDRETATA